MARSGDLTDRVQRRWRALRMRTRFHLGLSPRRPGNIRIASDFRHPVDASRKSALTLRYRELFPESVDRELAEARRLAAHSFSFLAHTVQHGEFVAWLRDPVSGRDWSRGYSPGIAYRGPQRLGDIKLPWELNKHQYFFTLGKASWLSGESWGSTEIVRQILHWIEDNPFNRGINWI